METQLRKLPKKLKTLLRGSHSTPENGLCVMEAVAFVAGEEHSDHPQCACPVVSAFMRAWNDSLPDDKRQVLAKYISKLVGSRSTTAVEEKRSYLALDWYVRVFTPTWLELAGLSEHAETLRTLGKIATLKEAQAARPAVLSARDKAAAAGTPLGTPLGPPLGTPPTAKRARRLTPRSRPPSSGFTSRPWCCSTRCWPCTRKPWGGEP